MRRKLRARFGSVLLTMAMLLSLLPVTAGAVEKTTYVDASYSEGNSDGSESKPYTTIQEAVDAATGENNTIKVMAVSGHEYAPFTAANLKNLTIEGVANTQGEKPVIKSNYDGSPVTVYMGSGAVVPGKGMDGLKLEGLVFKNYGYSNEWFSSSISLNGNTGTELSGAVINNCDFIVADEAENIPNYAVFLSTDTFTFTGNTVTGYKNGISCMSDNSTLNEVTITGNNFDVTSNVIYLYHGQYDVNATGKITFTGNTVENGSIELFDYANSYEDRGVSIKQVITDVDTSEVPIITTAINQTTTTFKTSDGEDVTNIVFGYQDAKQALANTSEGDTFYINYSADKTEENVEYTKTGEESYTDASGTTFNIWAAEINDTKYETLAKAVEEADSSATITLLSNITLTEPIKLESGKDITINGGENKYSIFFEHDGGAFKTVFTGSASGEVEGIPSNVKLTVNNVKFVNTSTKYTSQGYAVLVGSNSYNTEIKLDGCSFENLYCGVIANYQNAPADSTANKYPSISITNSTFIDTTYGYSIDETTPGCAVDVVNPTFTGNTDESGANMTAGEPWFEVKNANTVTKYNNLAAAIAAANGINGSDPVTVTINKSGEYAFNATDFPAITRSKVTVEAAEGVEATFKVTATVSNLFQGDSITLRNLHFVSSADCDIISYFEGEYLTLEKCSFTGNGHGRAIWAYTDNISITNCEFTNFERGYYACCDNNPAGEVTITGNIFTNVRVPIDGYWGKTATTTTNIQITDNTITPGSWGTSYIQLWDYAQYLKWLQGDKLEEDRNGSAIKATIKDNIYNGNVVIYATHFNWYWSSESELELDEASKALLKYRVLVELENAESATVTNANGTPITAFNEETTSSKRGNKQVIYAISEGDYIFNIKPTSSTEGLVTQKVEVKPTTANASGSTTNKVSVTSGTVNVAKINDTPYTSLTEALNYAKDNDTITLLSNVVLTERGLPGAAISGKTLTIDGDGHTLSFAYTPGNNYLNAVFGNNNNPLYGDTTLTVKNLTIENTGTAGSGYGAMVAYDANGTEITYEKCTFKNMFSAAYVNAVRSDPDNGVKLNIKGCNYINTPRAYAVDETSPNAYRNAVIRLI